MANNTSDAAHVLEMADALAMALKQSPIVAHLIAAEQLYRTDPGVQSMIKKLRAKAEEFQEAERAGSLREEQLREFRELQTRFQSHPLLRNFNEAREAAGVLLQETNSIISQMLGVDFGRTAGPAGGGCC